MTSNFYSKVERLKSRRKGSIEVAGMDSLLESTQILVNRSRQKEVWESRAANKSATKYAIGAMQEVDPVYTRVSIETGERIENQLSKRLTAEGISAVFRLQGSVPLNIHIKGVSDVDLLVIEQQLLMYDQHGSRASTYTNPRNDSLDVLQNLRNVAENILDDAFPRATVHKENAKSIKVTGGSLARDVDVVPAVWWDTANYQNTQLESDRGVAILDKTVPEKIYNTPFLHIKLVANRCQQTFGGLRKSIRLLKNVKADAEEDGKSINLSSFDIASIMYHCDIYRLQKGYFHELAILSETQYWLDYLWSNFDYAKTLYVPDSTRRIFDNDGKRQDLMKLSLEIDDLLKEVAKEQNAAFENNQILSLMRDYISTVKID
ncbi:TPA: hypothetical protein ACGQ50_001274 [Enterobacter cloacae]|uniref:hypothetical protein n=1 Tax=Enterobacter cloacae TaxID=550 RepID=UPI003464B18A